MADWLSALLPIATAVLILAAPGYLIARALTFRGLFAWGFAGPISLFVLGIAALGAPVLGVRWSVIPVIGTTAIVAIVVVVLRLTLPRRFRLVDANHNSAGSAVPVALLIGMLLITAQFVLSVGNPENISQTYDNVFHLNVIRYILDTGNASPLHVSGVTRPGYSGFTFYPAVWHALVSLVADTSGASIPVASNASMIAAAAVLWPAALLTFGVTLFGRSRSYILAAGILSAAAPAFPLLMINYGVLYPYFLALCALPAAVAAVLQVLQITADARSEARLLPWLLLIPTLVVGLFLTHPSAFVAWLVLAALISLVAFIRLARSRPPARTMLPVSAAFVVGIGVAIVLWRVVRTPVDQNMWPPHETFGQAIGEVLTQSMEGAPIPLVLAAAVLAGAVLAWRSRSISGRVAVAILAVLLALDVVAASMPWLWIRKVIVGAWYVNSPRLAALIPMIAVPLAAFAVAFAWRTLTEWIETRRPNVRSWTLGPIGAVALIVATQSIAVPDAIKAARFEYIPSSNSPLLSPDERSLIEALPTLVPRDAVIAGNPGTGVALAFALAGIHVVHPAIDANVTRDSDLIDGGINHATPGSSVCRAVDRLGVDYVLDFGTREVNGESHPYPGMRSLDSSPAVSLVKRIGEASLYKIVACE